MHKSVLKRIKITKGGKIMRRSMAIDNFRTRKTSKNLRHKRNRKGLNYPIKRIINY